jgi:hypothetical protein
MTTWLYYDKDLTQSPDKDCETIGLTQLKIMLRAREARSGLVMLTEGDERERMAAKRLVKRGLLRRCVERPKSVGQKFTMPTAAQLRIYSLTNRGRHCWLRVAK